MWQPAQLSRFIRGPSPSGTSSASSKSSCPTLKYTRSDGVRSANAVPASAPPPRTPGSTAEPAAVDAICNCSTESSATTPTPSVTDATDDLLVFIHSSSPGAKEGVLACLSGTPPAMHRGTDLFVCKRIGELREPRGSVQVRGRIGPRRLATAGSMPAVDQEVNGDDS